MTRDVLGRSVKTLSRFSGRGWPRLCEAGRGLFASAHSASSVVLLALFLSLAFATSTHAQTPTPSDALTAFRTTDAYIRNWSVPQTPIPKDADPKLNPRAVGVCITLKLRGEIIARGTSWSATIAGPDAPDPDLTRQAALAAIQQAEPKLGVPNDAFRDDAIEQVVKDIAISLELAGPLSAVEFDTWDQAELALRPGLDGVAAQIRTLSASEGRTSPPAPLHATFPSQMLLTNTLPHRALGGAASKALGEGGAAAALDEPKKLREQSGVRMYRFRVAHAVQFTANSAADILYRGQSLAAPEQLHTVAQLRSFADSLCSFLVAQQLPGGIEGDRAIRASWPSLGGKHAPVATDNEYLLAAFSVESYRQYLKVGGVPKADRTDPRWQFVHGASTSSTANSPGAPALFLLIGPAMDRPPGDPTGRAWLQRSLIAVLAESPVDGATPDDRRMMALVDPRQLPIELRPLVLLAGVRAVEPTAVAMDKPLQDCFASVSPGQLPTLMPWLGWAAVDQARWRRDRGENIDIPSALALRRMRDQVWQHQLSATDVTEDTLDMAGGIVFTSGLEAGKGGGNPYPTWQCVRPLAFIATMLGDPRLTEPSERPREIARLMQAMRYLRQLQVDDAASWMYPDPALAKGGIRAAVWDNSLPIDATSLTLLTVVELLKSLDELSKPAAPATPPLQPNAPATPPAK